MMFQDYPDFKRWTKAVALAILLMLGLTTIWAGVTLY